MPTVKELLGRFRGRGAPTPQDHLQMQFQMEENARARRESARMQVERYNMSVSAIRALQGISSSRLSIRSERSDRPEPAAPERRSKRMSLNPNFVTLDDIAMELSVAASDGDTESTRHSIGHPPSFMSVGEQVNPEQSAHVSKSLSRMNEFPVESPVMMADLNESPANTDSANSGPSDESQRRGSGRSSRAASDRRASRHNSTSRHNSRASRHNSRSSNTSTSSRRSNGGTSRRPSSRNTNAGSSRDAQTGDPNPEPSPDVEMKDEANSDPVTTPDTNDPANTDSKTPDLEESKHDAQPSKKNGGSTKDKKKEKKKSKSKSRAKSRHQRPQSKSRDFSHITESVESIPDLLSLINEDDPAAMLFATITVRKILSVEQYAPIQEVVDAGFVSRLVEFLRFSDHPSLQYEAAWALTNIASGTSEHTQCVVSHGALPPLIDLLGSPRSDIREQAVWAIGNISGDSPSTRDTVLRHGALLQLIRVAHNPALKVSLQKNIAWTCSNFCRGNPIPQLSDVTPMLPTLKKFLEESNDEEVLTDACWALAYMSDGAQERIQAVIDSGICSLVVNKLLVHSSPWVITPALRTVGNIVTGDQNQTQTMLDLNVLGALKQLLVTHKLTKLKSEACWTISNITAGTVPQVQMVIDSGIVEEVVKCASHREFTVAKEAIWALSNATTAGTILQREALINQGIIPVLAFALKNPAWREHSRFIYVTLEAVENLLRAGNNLDRSAGESRFATLMREHGAHDEIRNEFVTSSDADIKTKAEFILEQYFEADRPRPARQKEQPEIYQAPVQQATDSSDKKPKRKSKSKSKRSSSGSKGSGKPVEEEEREAPPQFLCPISQDIMIDPVITMDGHCYDRYNIQRWFDEGNNTSPVTGKELRGLALVPNHTLRQLIEVFKPGHTFQADFSREWVCESCTVLNKKDVVVCSVCMDAKPRSVAL